MLLNKRIIYLIIFLAAVVLVAELAWAYAALYKSESKTSVTNLNATTSAEPTASISLMAPKATISVGETDTVTINVSANTPTDGTDIIINFDPKLVEVMLSNGSPITVSAMYNQYPNNHLDVAKGVVTISGISSEKTGVLANGIFGTMVLKAKAVGKTTVSVIYVPGSTNDSNVIETSTGKDVLGTVLNLQLNIAP
ncbi:MAG: cohesin domain-containing protein [Candidatus Daviesbacteria bacterium]|nr:cohesin domain-containing protein [Candidatus Daviesbacteria bacterium]